MSFKEHITLYFCKIKECDISEEKCVLNRTAFFLPGNKKAMTESPMKQKVNQNKKE